MNRAVAEETAPAKSAVTETKKEDASAAKSEHCERCQDKKHGKDCEKKCPDCHKEKSAKCEHCKGEKDRTKCKKCHDKDAEKKSDKSAKRSSGRVKTPAVA